MLSKTFSSKVKQAALALSASLLLTPTATQADSV